MGKETSFQTFGGRSGWMVFRVEMSVRGQGKRGTYKQWVTSCRGGREKDTLCFPARNRGNEVYRLVGK